MKPRFEPDVQTGANQDLSSNLIDPEAYDASEQEFAASLEPSISTARQRFIVEDRAIEPVKIAAAPLEAEAAEAPQVSATAPQARPVAPEDPDAWRSEVAARLSHYRARRRPREPRYPSLQLKFEPEPNPAPAAIPAAEPWAPAMREAWDDEPAPTPAPVTPRITLAETVYPRVLPSPTTEMTAKVIEFASYNPAPRAIDELAEPVFDRPRIIEAPELAPPPPALGGILIEPVEEPANERRPGFEIPLQAAPMTRRIMASAIDFALVISAFSAFAGIFLRFAADPPPLSKIVTIAAGLIAAFWSAYQYLLLVYSGSTPGLRMAKLELHRFDGSPVPLRVRRWRVLTSMLSGLSLGLGYAWCFLDEDKLCWHDRITRTYTAPKKLAPPGSTPRPTPRST